MITYSMMGRVGQLGNQMFQYAAMLAAANNRGAEFAIPTDIEIRGFNNLSCRNLDPGHEMQYQFRESGFGFDGSLFEIKDDTNIFGTFQSPKYFENLRDRLKGEFQFSDQELELAKRVLGTEKSCAVHIRGGDYLEKPDVHVTLSKRYYVEAIAEMKMRGYQQFIVFTDDPDWAATRIELDNSMRMQSASAFQDLCTMTLCHGHIIANSSFSWWGAYLADSEYVIAPARWFGENGPNRWQDLYCAEWRVL